MNKHYESAEEWANQAPVELHAAVVNAGTAQRADLAAQLAQAQAILALAYEQRTANLIASLGILLDSKAQIAAEIQERLGLK